MSCIRILLLRVWASMICLASYSVICFGSIYVSLSPLARHLLISILPTPSCVCCCVHCYQWREIMAHLSHLLHSSTFKSIAHRSSLYPSPNRQEQHQVTSCEHREGISLLLFLASCIGPESTPFSLELSTLIILHMLKETAFPVSLDFLDVVDPFIRQSEFFPFLFRI